MTTTALAPDLVTRMHTQAQVRPKQLFLRYHEQGAERATLTYAEFDQQVTSLAGPLAARFQAKERVMIMFDPHPKNRAEQK